MIPGEQVTAPGFCQACIASGIHISSHCSRGGKSPVAFADHCNAISFGKVSHQVIAVAQNALTVHLEQPGHLSDMRCQHHRDGHTIQNIYILCQGIYTIRINQNRALLPLSEP